MRDFVKYSKRVTFLYRDYNLGQRCLKAKSDETFSPYVLLSLQST